MKIKENRYRLNLVLKKLFKIPIKMKKIKIQNYKNKIQNFKEASLIQTNQKMMEIKKNQLFQ